MDPKSGKGPRPRLTIPGITSAAVALADEDGLDGLSMRRLAQRLDVAPMNLYAYVPGKAELLDLTVDRGSGEVLDDPLPAAWRAEAAGCCALQLVSLRTASDAAAAFDFGPERILDGVAALLEQ